MKDIDVSEMTPVERLSEKRDEESVGLHALALEARKFLLSHGWARSVKSGYLDRGWAGVIAVFYFPLEVTAQCPDNGVWIVVGDVPPAYMDIMSCRNGAQALQSYCNAMEEWVHAVEQGESTEACIPVLVRDSLLPVPHERDVAAILMRRINLIREEILPEFLEELSTSRNAS